MDTVPSNVRSKIMRQVKSKNTKPELVVRSLLHKLGFRFRLHDSKLPGCPDIVLRRYNAAIFVHGCFWHRHKGCRRATTPAINKEYWNKKFSRNIARDKNAEKELRGLGWRAIVVWECEIKHEQKLIRRFLKLLSS